MDRRYLLKRRFGISGSSFVELSVSRETALKVQDWLDKGHVVSVYTYSDSDRLLLLNETLSQLSRLKKLLFLSGASKVA